jgi:predicted RND superfamily exporter protein
MARWASWVAFVERRHRALLAGALVLTLASALSLLALRFDFDVLTMLPTGAPAFDNFKTFVADFGELDELVVLAECPDTARLRAFADAFAARLRTLDSVTAVQGKIDVAQIQQGLLGKFLYNYLPVTAYDEIAARLTAEGIDAQVRVDRAILQAPFDLSAAQLIRRDPLGFTRLAGQALSASFDDATFNVNGGYLSTPDGTALLILVRPTRSAFDMPFTTRFMEQVHAVAAAARRASDAPADLRVGYTGSYAFALEDAATLKGDVARYTLLALAGVLAVFYAGYRNLRILPFVTYPLVVSTLLTFAASLLCYAHLNAVSIAFAAILYGLSIDSGIHYYTRLLQELRGHDRRTAVTRTLAHLGGANVVASGTTAAAFAVIGFSELTGVSQLGFLTAIGMLINIVEFFVLYPALSFWMARPSIATRRLDTPRVGRLAAACAQHARALAWGTAVLTAGLAVLASGVDLDVDLTHLRPSVSSAAQVEAEITARFGSAGPAGAVLVTAPTLEEALQGSERIERQLRVYREQNLVATAWGITTLLPSARTQRQRLALFAQLPRQASVQALQQALPRYGFRPEQFAEFASEFTRSHTALVEWPDARLAPFAPVIERHVRERGGGVTVATYVQPADAIPLASVADRLERDVPDLSFTVAGRSLLQDELGRMLRRELVGFFLAAFTLNLILVLMSVRQFGTAVAILLPQGVVIVLCLALMHLTGAGIGPVNIIVVPLILGIGVDHCVYVAERWQHGERIGDAVCHGGRAVLVSGLTTTAGFGFLGLSRYPALANMGLLAAACLLMCLVAAVTLFPALVTLLAPQGRARQESGEWPTAGETETGDGYAR